MKNKDDTFKATRTTRYLLDTSRTGGCDGSTGFSPPPSPPGRTFVRRLSWRVTPKITYDVRELAYVIANNSDNALFFADTSLFDLRTDERLWDALLNDFGKLVIVPDVLRELEPWLQTNATHVAAKAILNRNPAVQLWKNYTSSEEELHDYHYYANLLAFRKQLLGIQKIQFEQKNGSAPDEAKLKREVHRRFGPRGFLLARKGAEAADRTNFTDEKLVYSAVTTGIRLGRPVYVLSKDEDVQEQFYKLLWLLDTHYRGMLLADAYAFNPSGFVIHSMPDNIPAFNECFEGGGNVLLEKEDESLEYVLPTLTYHFVDLHCLIVGEKLTAMVFGAEQEMGRLLSMKSETRGLNTNRLEGRNCHIWIAPLDVPHKFRNCAVVAYDKRLTLPKTSIQLPLLDVNHAIGCYERFRQLKQLDPNEIIKPPFQQG